MGQIVPFPSHKVGLKPGDHVAEVTCAEGGHALTIRPLPDVNNELTVFAHNDLVVDIQTGDYVRVSYTSYGPLIIERLARPGNKPLPRAEYNNGSVYIDPNDPAWRLYE